MEYVQPLPGRWTLTPFVRLYAQNAASFYVEALNDPSPERLPLDVIQSQDQRLSSFGGASLGMKVSKLVTPDVLVDFRYERYEQHTDWYPFGDGSVNLEPFKANIFQVGMTWYF